MLLSIHPASMRMSKTTPSRKVYKEPESNSWVIPEGLSQGTEDAQQQIHWLPKLRMLPEEAEIAPLCPRPAEVTMEPSAPHSSQPENLTNTWWELGAALTWDWQPPAGTSLGAAALCPLEKAQQFVVRGLCLQEHHPQAISEIKQICLGFLSRKFSFFCLLGFVQTTHRG